MKNGKKLFILIESILAVMIVVLSSVMIREKNRENRNKVSVIIQNPDDNQWAAFKYGLKMAAEEHSIEMFVANIEGTLTAKEEKGIIEHELEHGADAVIVQPVLENGMEKILQQIGKKIPVMLVGHTASGDGEDSGLPVTEPDHYAVGATLAEELLKDYNGNIAGKTFGILSETACPESAASRKKGFEDTIKGTGAEIAWFISNSGTEDGKESLYASPKVDFIIALDNNSLTVAGSLSAANDLHGALLYGIGNSTEAVYYLDIGTAECLIVPDEFNVGYQSLTEVAEGLEHYFYKMQSQTVSFSVIRRETLFSKENQEILFTMSQ